MVMCILHCTTEKSHQITQLLLVLFFFIARSFVDQTIKPLAEPIERMCLCVRDAQEKKNKMSKLKKKSTTTTTSANMMNRKTDFMNIQ